MVSRVSLAIVPSVAMALSCTNRSADDAKHPPPPAKSSVVAEPTMPASANHSAADSKPTSPSTPAAPQPERSPERSPERIKDTLLERARKVLIERQVQRHEDQGMPGLFCPEKPGRVDVDGPTLRYTFDIRVLEPGADPDDLPERLSPPFGIGGPAQIDCIFAVADAVYTEIEGADELRVTMNEAGRLFAEIRFSRALYESLDVMNFFYDFTYASHEFDEGEGGTKRGLRKMWDGFIAKIPAERRREGGSFHWRSSGR